MGTNKKNYFKFFLGLIFCLFVRLIPVRAPNVEPIFATMMPMSKAYGTLAGFSFATLSILLYDLLTGTLGIQTFFTAGAYGILGLWAGYYFQKNQTNSWSYVRFAIIGTLFFDAITGLTVGPVFFHQTFLNSLLGQIPFTLLHLISNVTFAFILSPAIYDLLVKKKKEKKVHLIQILNPKII